MKTRSSTERRSWILLQSALIVGSVLVAQPVLAGQNSNNNPTPPEVLISEVLPDFSGLPAASGDCLAGDEVLTIRGGNFDNGASPTVVLGKQGALALCSAIATEIVAACPGGVCPTGDFLLSVTTGPAVKDYDEYDLTIGAVGPQGEQGPQGEPGVSGYQRLSCGLITVSNPIPNGVGAESVTCPCPAGKKAVAGGIADLRFPITVANSRDFNIAALHPQNDTQWRVRFYNGTGASINVTLYTVCVDAN